MLAGEIEKAWRGMGDRCLTRALVRRQPTCPLVGIAAHHDPRRKRADIARPSEKGDERNRVFLNASVAAPTADDCTTLIYRRRPAKRAPESFASQTTSGSIPLPTDRG